MNVALLPSLFSLLSQLCVFAGTFLAIPGGPLILGENRKEEREGGTGCSMYCTLFFCDIYGPISSALWHIDTLKIRENSLTDVLSGVNFRATILNSRVKVTWAERRYTRGDATKKRHSFHGLPAPEIYTTEYINQVIICPIKRLSEYRTRNWMRAQPVAWFTQPFDRTTLRLKWM